MTDIDTDARDKLLMAWTAAKGAAATAIENERQLRLQVVGMLFPGPVVEGTSSYDLGRGFKVKYAQSFTYDICKEPGKRISHEEHVARVDTVVTEIEELGGEGTALAARLVKWKPELSATEYKKLDTDFPVQAAIKKILDRVITTKADSPQVSLEVPK